MLQPERQTLLISGWLLCLCPFAQPMRMKVAGWVTLSKTGEPLQIYTIHPSVGHGAVPLVQSCCRPDSPQSCLSISHTQEAHRGVVITEGQFVIPVSLHHRRHYLGLLSIKKKTVNASKKVCTLSLCYRGCWLHRALIRAKQTWGNYSGRRRLTEPRGRELPWTSKLSPAGIPTPDPYANILCTNCTAVQSPWWNRHFQHRRIFLLAAARCCLQALTPAPQPGNTDD